VTGFSVVSLAATALSLLFGVPAAYALSRWRFRARRSIALWILATRMAPPVAFTIPFFLAYRFLGLIDSLVGLVVIYLTFNLALVVWLMRNFFEGVPPVVGSADRTAGPSRSAGMIGFCMTHRWRGMDSNFQFRTR
jgi:multiple sugar transport system permease protein